MSSRIDELDIYVPLAVIEIVSSLEEEVERLRADAERWNWFVRHASLGFDQSPSWNAVIRLPVFSSDDDTITKLVDRGRREAK